MSEQDCTNMPDLSPLPVTVLLVDDHAIWRGGVQSMLEDTEFTVVGEAASGKEALEVARRVVPRLTLLDIRMAGGDGLEALVSLKQEHPRMAVVMFTTYENPAYLSRAVAGGAAGYLLKGIEREDMLSALRAIVAGEMLLKKKEIEQALRNVHPQTSENRLATILNDGEQEVLRMMIAGHSRGEIASTMGVDSAILTRQVAQITHKLEASDCVQALVRAVRQGLVTQAASGG